MGTRSIVYPTSLLTDLQDLLRMKLGLSHRPTMVEGKKKEQHNGFAL